jgi:hypothetical protein
MDLEKAPQINGGTAFGQKLFVTILVLAIDIIPALFLYQGN